MGEVAAWLSLIAEPFGILRTRTGDAEYPPVRLCDRERHSILKTPQSEVSARGNVPSLPNDVGIESHHPTRPAFVSSNCLLQNKLVDLKEKPFVFGGGPRRFSLVGAREKYVANPNQLGGSYWVQREVASKAIPVAVVHAN
jgi:hypothetical protein